MIKYHIKFITTSQLIIFHNVCKDVCSDVQIHAMTDTHPVNGKKLSELTNLRLGLPVLLMIHGDDEVEVISALQKYGLCASE